MIEDNSLKNKDIILIYSRPPEECDIGIIQKYKYPNIIVRLIRRDSFKQQINKTRNINLINEIIYITPLDSDKIKQVLSENEQKRLNELKKIIQNEEEDIFAEIE